MKTRTTSGPDGTTYWFWPNYADYLASIITKIFNNSIEQQRVQCYTYCQGIPIK